MHERRRHKRIKCGFKALVMPSQNARIRLSAFGIDISEGGLKLSLASNIIVGSTVIVHLYRPNGEVAMSIMGDVVYSRISPNKTGTYETGIKFSVSNIADRKRVVEYVNEIVREKNKRPEPELEPMFRITGKKRKAQDVTPQQMSLFVFVIIMWIILTVAFFYVIGRYLDSMNMSFFR